MSTSLYQKYRPATFNELVGQAHVRTTLLNELKQNAVSHAYLFSGPRGIGKTTSARLVARAINCLQPKEGEPCNLCDHCRLILEGRALDVIEMDAASHTGVDHVRENIIENARVAPSQLQWKVFIIDEVHMLSTSAFNALLKTLEEPPAKTIFILATTEIHKVPATIISRCERFQFRKISFEDMRARLAELARKEGVKVDDDVLDAIVKRSEGALRDAESMLGQVLALDDAHVTFELAQIVVPRSDLSEVIGLWEEIIHRNTAAGMERIQRLYEEGVGLNEFSRDVVETLRKLLLYKVQGSLKSLEYLDVGPDELKHIQTLCEAVTPQQMMQMIERFIEAQQQMKSTEIPQLPLELAVVHMTAIGMPVAQSAPGGPFAEKSNASVDAVTETPQKEAPPAAARTDLTIEEIRTQWSQLLSGLKEENHALHLTFKVGQLVSFDGRVLTMGYEYQFYQDRLNDAHNRPAIDKVFTAVFGAPIVLETVVGPQYAPGDHNPAVENVEQPSEEEVANVWDLASNSFGAD